MSVGLTSSSCCPNTVHGVVIIRELHVLLAVNPGPQRFALSLETVLTPSSDPNLETALWTGERAPAIRIDQYNLLRPFKRQVSAVRRSRVLLQFEDAHDNSPAIRVALGRGKRRPQNAPSRRSCEVYAPVPRSSPRSHCFPQVV